VQFNVNTDAVVSLTNKLEKLHRSAFPVAVRSTLNSAAFDMKGNTILSSAAGTFVQRKPSFFKASSRVDSAKGFDVNTMRAMVGFTGKSQAVEDLEQQEHGGKIEGRSFVPMRTARTSTSDTKPVRANARLSRIKVVSTANTTGKNEAQKFVKSVLFAGVGGNVLSEWNGKKYLWRVNSLKRTKEGQFKLTPLYSFEKGRDVKVSATGFMEKSTMQTATKMDDFFFRHAEKQFQKALL